MRADIQILLDSAEAFVLRLEALKSTRELAWYPYNSLAALEHLDRLLTGPNRRLMDLIGNSEVLDIGCGDGELAFYLESFGCKVKAIDHPPTNWNGMRGVRELKQALGSNISIEEMDLDRQFQLQGRFGMAFFLGILYHLKNPYHALEELAQHCRYCVLSTRVARIEPQNGVQIHDLPVAYLLGHRDANGDATNYWVFSEAGLRRLLERTNWQVLDFMSVGNTFDSDPITEGGDERAFFLLRSRASHRTFRGSDRCELLYGWHPVEDQSWRWTERKFGAMLQPGPLLRLEFLVHEAVLKSTAPLTLTVNGGQAQTYTDPGPNVYLAETKGVNRFDFELSSALPPHPGDQRELGLLVWEITIE